MYSRGLDGVVLNQDEEGVQHFHDWLASGVKNAPSDLI